MRSKRKTPPRTSACVGYLLSRRSAYQPRPNLVLSFRSPVTPVIPSGPQSPFRIASLHPRCRILRDRSPMTHCVQSFFQPAHAADTRVPRSSQIAAGRRFAPSPTLNCFSFALFSFCTPGRSTTTKDDNYTNFQGVGRSEFEIGR